VILKTNRRPFWIGLLVALAVVVQLPAVGAQFMADDYDQAAMIEGRFPGGQGPFNLYDFINNGNRSEIIDLGVFPWFMSPKLFIRLLRPLPSALLWADHRLFGKDALLPHIHSLLWWALACVAVYALLAQCFNKRVAFIGTIAYTFAPCHSFPLVWLANREALVSNALGALSLAAYARWREAPGARKGLVALGLSALALSAGEYSLGFTGYVVAMELVRRGESLARRALCLACFALPLAVYLAVHTALGYGAYGAADYCDPFRDLPLFLSVAPRRFGVLVSDVWLGAANDSWWGSTPSWIPILTAAVVLTAVALLLSRAIRTLVGEERRRALWLFFGSLICLIPAVSVFASVRLLGVSMIGVSAIVALIIDRAWFPPEGVERRGAAELTELAALGLAFVHLVLAPLDTWLANRQSAQATYAFNERTSWVRDHAGGSTTILALRAESFLLSMPLMFRDRVRWRLLTLGSPRSLVLRTGDRAIEMVSNPEPLMPNSLQINFRSELLRAGDVVDVPGMRVTILQLDSDGAPHRIRFEFDRDLDDPSMFWVAEGPTGFREQRPPSPGYAELVEPAPE
jgi:hypothetical protein